MKRFALIFALIGAGLIGGSFFTASSTLDLREVAVEVPGQIVGIAESQDDDGTSYAPIYEYEVDGRTLRHESSVSTSSRPTIGDTETLLVDPSDPTRAKADTFMDMWFVPVLLGGLGSVFFLIGAGVGLAALAKGRTPSDPAAPSTLGIPGQPSASSSPHAPDHSGHDPFVGDDDPTEHRGPFV